MHYSIHQELARARHDDLLREATQARLAASARQRNEPAGIRLSMFRTLLQWRLPQRRPVPST